MADKTPIDYVGGPVGAVSSHGEAGVGEVLKPAASPNKAELRRLAEELPKNCSPYTRAYAEFRDKANPAAVLSLLDELDRMQATCDGLDRQNDAIAEEIGEVTAERDAALAELEALRQEKTDWQKECLKKGFEYVRESDDHYVVADPAEMVSLLRDLLGIDVRQKDGSDYGVSVAELEKQVDGLVNTIHMLEQSRRDAEAESARLNLIVNSPQSDDFLRAVSTEAEHQRQRWGSEHDSGKQPADWFWLVGYLAGKALHAHAAGDAVKAEHHVITTAAALANWHSAMFGNTNMRPGIDGDAAMSQEVVHD